MAALTPPLTASCELDLTAEAYFSGYRGASWEHTRSDLQLFFARFKARDDPRCCVSLLKRLRLGPSSSGPDCG